MLAIDLILAISRLLLMFALLAIPVMAPMRARAEIGPERPGRLSRLDCAYG